MELKSLTLNGKTYDRFASDVLIVTTDVNVASHSASEIKAAAEAGKTVFINSDGSPLPLSTYSADKATFVEPMSNTTTGSFGEMRVFVDNKKELTYELKSFKVYSKDQTDEKIASAVEDALTQAKANGDFKGDPGKDGADGQDGYTPVKGLDYFDGADGKDGKDGQDGYTPQKNIDYFDGKDGKDGVNGKDGYTPQKGIDYFDGKDGQPGADGKTPVKGTDYWTAADKSAMVSDVLAALPTWTGGSY